MIFDYRYHGSSSVSSSTSGVGMNFAPDTLREPTFFVGQLNKHIPFREAISALHDVVIMDSRYTPKDRNEYQAWLKEQEPIWLAEALAKEKQVQALVTKKREELTALQQQRAGIMAPFNKAKRTYFDYLYKKDMDAWYVLDPVITVHPDEVFFECFSQDESAYGKLGCNYEVFRNISDFKCGTTNVDYSATLYNEFQKIRDYKTTELKVDPSGFEVQTEMDEAYKEVKIDLPDTWLRGFLQVSSAMTIPAHSFDLHPMDVHNFLFLLRRMKAKESPRSIRFILKPGHPVKAIFEPWNHEVICHRSIYTGEKTEVRIWGRRRLLILERLLPIAKRFTVTLLGSGMPSFWVADLGDMNFTLGLSGWSSNDWSRSGNFDLLAPRAEVDALTQQRVFLALKENWRESAESLSTRLQLDRSVVLGALGSFVQAGRAIFDMDKKVFRVRELARDPLPMSELRFANPREEAASRFLREKSVKVKQVEQQRDRVKISGHVRDKGKDYTPVISIDNDERLIDPVCTCNFFQQNKLFKGPCEHILALRMAFSQRK
ncbi:MAG TPA: SWIM zinc finger family protein [Bacteroidetes bacterium]|nr:SWIM zinc finger family protein [Bacteroidota bacterium]